MNIAIQKIFRGVQRIIFESESMRRWPMVDGRWPTFILSCVIDFGQLPSTIGHRFWVS